MRVRHYCIQLDGSGRFCKLMGRSKTKLGKLKHPSYILYVMREGRRILYVGEARRGFYRCLQGFKLGFKESAAYKWRTDADLKEADIECLVFDGFKPNGVLKVANDRKAVEADLAFEVRTKLGYWPVKLSTIDVCGKIQRSAQLASFTSSIMRELRSRGWI